MEVFTKNPPTVIQCVKHFAVVTILHPFKIGNEPGVDNGYLINYDCDEETCPGGCASQWKYYNGSKWNEDNTIRVKCGAGRCRCCMREYIN